MKSIVIYYSYEGNTQLVAENIANELGASIFELKPLDERKRTSKLLKYMWGGSQVMMKKSPELQDIPKDLSDYDLIVLGTPIWAWTYAPPLRTLLDKVEIKGKKIALFSTNEGQNGKTFEHFKARLGDNEFVGELEIFAPLKKDKEKSLANAREWAKGLFN